MKNNAKMDCYIFMLGHVKDIVERFSVFLSSFLFLFACNRLCGVDMLT